MKTQTLAAAKFNLGQTVQTPSVMEEINPIEAYAALQRHRSGDWGDCSDADKARNDDAVRDGDRIFSVYHDSKGTKFWIITEWDRSVTTILLPSDY